MKMMGLDRSQRETWDDTELVDSWNDALEEYKVSQAYDQPPSR